jgi:hypothetical protein
MLAPEALMRAVSDIIQDVCGTGCTYRDEPLTEAEWSEIEARVHLMHLMNMRQEVEQ